MPKKNDLSAYKAASNRGVLTAVPDQPAARRGRAPKPQQEKRSEKILLSLTPTERQALEAKAGMVPLATWLVANLREGGVFD